VAALQLRVTGAAGSRRVSTVVRGVFGNLGRNFLESLSIPPALAEDGLFREADPGLITRLKESGRPIVCLTAHFGNWDILAALMVQRGFDLTVIGREARSPALQQVLAALRARYGVKTIWRSEGPKVIRSILSALKSGGTVGALIDQDTRVAGTSVPFFGIPAHTPHSLLELAARTNAHLVGALLRRERTAQGWGGIVEVREFDAGKPAEEVLAEYHRFLEEQIRLAPEQWVWVHKRWRTRPDGYRESSREYAARLKAMECASFS
jgi:KDO2-lipid IV(A) lauroyltransferase